MQRTRVRRRQVGGVPTLTTSGGGKYGPSRRSEIESCTDVTNHGPPYKSGGPLNISKRTFQLGTTASTTFSDPIWGYSGSFYLEPPSPNLAIPADINLSGWGAKGFNRALPIHNELNLAQMAFEMKDFGQMVKSAQDFFTSYLRLHRGKGPKFWADQYLSGQFGWAPAASDVLSALQMQKRLAQRMAWMRAHSGKNIKRSFTLSSGVTNEQLSSVEGQATLQPILNTNVYRDLGKGMLVTRRSIEYRIWFAGCFTFYIPKNELVPGLPRDFLYTKLAGAVPDPVTFYKLTPWTWLLDWFTSAGAIVDNFMLQAKYHQIARYAYVMASQRTTVRSYGFQYVNTGPRSKPVPSLVLCSSATTVERKQRAVANPYGFGTTWDGLNPYQLSILAALGITRGKGSH